MDQSFTHDLFLSFSYHDQKFAQTVHKQLRSFGLDIFFSDDTLKDDLGTAFGHRIQDGVQGSQHFVLVASDHAFESPWVTLEWETFFYSIHLENPKQRRLFILPVAGYDVRSRPLFLRRLLPASSVEDIVRSVPLPDGNDRLNKKLALMSEVARQLEEFDATDTTSLMRELAVALDGLRRSNDTERVRVYYELVRQKFYPNWSEDQIGRFGKAINLIFNYQDVYVSYTNRNAQIINFQHERLIRELLPPQSRDDRETKNMVARAVSHYLKLSNVNVFSQHIDGQTSSNDVMKEFARHSLVLIQLLETASFVHQPRNWMFEEYREFMADRRLGDAKAQNRYLAIVLDDALESRSSLPVEYVAWLDHIRSIHHTSLASSSVEGFRSLLSEVVKVIIKRRRVMLDSLMSAPF